MSYTPEFINTLRDFMHEVLDGIVSVYGQAGLPLPDRRYVAAGSTVHDCEQLTVSLAQMYMGAPGDQAQTAVQCDAMRSAMVTIELVRCIPVTGRTAPTVEQIEAAADAQMIDAWMLLEAATAVASSHGFGGLLADVTPGEAQGGFQAIILNLTMGV